MLGMTEHNSLGGTISEFRDGDTDLGFEVILNRRAITAATGLLVVIPVLPRQSLVIVVPERASGVRNYSVLMST